MKYCGLLISVADMEKSKNFYEKVMEQAIGIDLGTHVSFINGFSLQSNSRSL
jgi:predicted enzyme related to lactoylglutathione lyase